MTRRKQVIQVQILKIEELYQHYQNNPFSPTIVHDLRVAIRALRALVHFVKKEFQLKNMNKSIKV